MADAHVQTWQRLLLFDPQPWVVFENGTCVLLANPEANLEVQARAVLAADREARRGQASCPMQVKNLNDLPGWVVWGPDPSIWAYVGYAEAGGPDANHEDVCRIARARIEKDEEAPKIIHVEERPR